MQFNEMPFDDAIPVDAYGPGMFRIAGQAYEGAVLLCGSKVVAWGGYDDPEALLAVQDKVDFVIVGTGPEMVHLPRAFRDRMEAEGLGLEPMATGTACRTFNVLASEGRRVAVALLPV